jgi:hypothetical protein
LVQTRSDGGRAAAIKRTKFSLRSLHSRNPLSNNSSGDADSLAFGHNRRRRFTFADEATA